MVDRKKKCCSRCVRLKPAAEFFESDRNRSNFCKACQRETKKEKSGMDARIGKRDALPLCPICEWPAERFINLCGNGQPLPESIKADYCQECTRVQKVEVVQCQR